VHNLASARKPSILDVDGFFARGSLGKYSFNDAYSMDDTVIYSGWIYESFRILSMWEMRYYDPRLYRDDDTSEDTILKDRYMDTYHIPEDSRHILDDED
jgi:hypothetical protein